MTAIRHWEDKPATTTDSTQGIGGVQVSYHSTGESRAYISDAYHSNMGTIRNLDYYLLHDRGQAKI